MPTPINPRGEDNPSSYFVEDRGSNSEMLRLIIQENFITEGMGGPLAEQPDPGSLRRVLDVGCGPGGWVLEAARLYHHMDLVGIDISWHMIEYARAQVQAARLSDGVEFHVMNALHPLEFPDASFDLVNMRLVVSWMLTKHWPVVLRELLRVARPGGIVRVTDSETTVQSNSPAQIQINQMFQCAFYKSGHLFADEVAGITPYLPQLLAESGCQNVQSQAHTLEYLGGTEGGENFSQNMVYGFHTLKPFLHKWGCITDDYDALCQQALSDVQQKDFRATWKLVTAWGIKPQESE